MAQGLKSLRSTLIPCAFNSCLKRFSISFMERSCVASQQLAPAPTHLMKWMRVQESQSFGLRSPWRVRFHFYGIDMQICIPKCSPKCTTWLQALPFVHQIHRAEMFQKVSRLSLAALDGSFNVRGASDERCLGIYEDSQAFNALERTGTGGRAVEKHPGSGCRGWTGFSRSVDGGFSDFGRCSVQFSLLTCFFKN